MIKIHRIDKRKENFQQTTKSKKKKPRKQGSFNKIVFETIYFDPLNSMKEMNHGRKDLCTTTTKKQS